MGTTEAQKKASEKWTSENVKKVTFKLYKGKDPSVEQIKRAAEREGLSMNSFIVECIRDKI